MDFIQIEADQGFKEVISHYFVLLSNNKGYCQNNYFKDARMVRIFWSERRCADGFVESAVGHYFWYFSTLVVVVVVVTTVAKLA